MTPFWITAFVDLAPEGHAEGLAFWRDVTGWEASPRRGDDGEFVTLVPPSGGDHLRVQRLTAGPSRVHLDLHVDDRGSQPTTRWPSAPSRWLPRATS